MLVWRRCAGAPCETAPSAQGLLERGAPHRAVPLLRSRCRALHPPPPPRGGLGPRLPCGGAHGPGGRHHRHRPQLGRSRALAPVTRRRVVAPARRRVMARAHRRAPPAPRAIAGPVRRAHLRARAGSSARRMWHAGHRSSTLGGGAAGARPSPARRAKTGLQSPGALCDWHVVAPVLRRRGYGSGAVVAEARVAGSRTAGEGRRGRCRIRGSQ